MRHILVPTIVLLATLTGAMGHAKAGTSAVNLIANPNFDHVYAATRQEAPDPTFERRMLPKFVHTDVRMGEGKPVLPYGWNLSLSKDEAATLSWVDDTGSKALRVRVPKGESARLGQSYVEVVPGGVYNFGLGVKGSGRVNLFVGASSPAPDESLVSTGLDAGAEWKQITARKKVGPHRHLAWVCIEILGPADVTIRQAELSVQTSSAAPANPLLVKPVKDADTIFYEDFDGPTQAFKLNSGARLTDKDGGRFGRGLVTSAKDGGAVTRPSFGDLPDKGTIEFWFKPSPSNGVGVPLAITTQTPGMENTQVEFHSNVFYGGGKIGFGFRQQYNYERATAEHAGWWQPGTWHHIAGAWDGDVVRIYGDGVMEAVFYGKDKTSMFPHGKAIDLLLSLDGVIDEIRISKCLRYGPVVPDGAKTVLYSLATISEQPKAAQAAKDVKEEELDKERAKLIFPVPQSKADYTFGIDQVRPAWESMSGMTVQKDYFGKGVDGIEARVQQESGHAMYWRIENIEPGDYYVGVWAESSTLRMRSEYGVDKLLATAYLNGWPVRFSTSTDPVQVRPGVWLAELQSRTPVTLKNGDEIAVWPIRFVDWQGFLRLALYRKAPIRGHGVTGQTFGVEGGNPQRLRLALLPEIKGSGEDGTKHEGRIEIANPLPYAVDALVTWKLADFYGTPLVDKTEPLHLEAHKSAVISHTFTASGDARAYQLDVKTRPAPGFKFPVPRPVEMLDLSDYSRWEFRPNQRDPLTVWNHIRKDLADDRTGDRKMLCLDGNDWEWAYLDGRRVPETMPADLAYSPGRVPFMEYWVPLAPGRFGKWFRKKFVVPDWMKGQRYVLELSKVESEGTVFLNGQRMGYGVGSLPVLVDVTKAIKPGAANELVICVRGSIATMKPDFVDRYDLQNIGGVRENVDVYCNDYDAPCLKSVYLRVLPELRVKQGLVLPDAEQGKLRVMTRLENSGSQQRQVTLRFEVFQNGKAVAITIPEKSVTVDGGTVAETTVDASAGDLVPWTPANPVMAKMVTTVLEDGKAVDTFERRFGYRDLKVKGDKLALNGKPIWFFSQGCAGYSQEFFEADCFNFSRGHMEYQDLADEIGFPYLVVVYNCGPTTWPKLNNKKYWDSWLHFLVEKAWDEGSRPGAVGWVLSCETIYTLYVSGKEGQEKIYGLIYSGAQELRKKIWPYYFCLASGDGCLGGQLDFYSGHYWNQWEGGFAAINYSDVSSPCAPDSFFLNGAAVVPRKGTVMRMNPDWTYGSTAAGSTEDMEFIGFRNGPPNSKYIGDRVAVSSAYQFFDSRGMAWTKMALDSYRDMDLAVCGSVYWHNFYGAANPKVSFCVPQQEIRYYSGAKFDRRLDIFDGEYRPGKLNFQWRLLDQSGKTVRHGDIQAQSDTFLLKRDRIAFDIPQVSERSRFTLNMELSKDGTRWAREERMVDVWPTVESSPTTALKETVRVFDPKKALLPCLEKIGCKAQAIDSLDASALAGAKFLIVGPDCVTKAMADKWDLVRDFVRDGGRVLMLHQDDASLLPLDVTIEQKTWRSAGFVRVPKHPVMNGLKDVDFQMWNPGHVIVKGAFRTPEKGAFLTLLDSGHDEKTGWAEMVEFYFAPTGVRRDGQGSMLATQLSLTDKFDTEPMAAELLKRLLAYMAQPVFRAESNLIASTKSKQPDAPLAVLSGASEAVLKRLGEVRTDYVTVASATPERPVTLLDLNTDKAPSDAATLCTYVQQGGTLFVHRASPRHQDWLESLTGKKVSVQVQPYKAWGDKQMLERRDGLVTGLSNLDLYWRTFLATREDGFGWWQVSCGVEPGDERGEVQYVVRVDGVADYLFPGGLVEVPVGKGRVIIDQLKWEMSSKDMVCGSPNRCISMFLTNLGVARKLPMPKPVLPKGVTYETIDLSSLANRSFKDDKAGDGVGWLDWGPDADMRSFPTGNVNLGDVPYLVPAGEKNAIVLRMNPDWVKCLEKYPDTVTIPVKKRRVAGLLFLHTGGWAGGAASFGERRIEYDDGTREIIRLNGTNMTDWNPGLENFPDEEMTTTTVVWKGANTQYPVIRVYQTLWVNPHPEKHIKQVVISNAGIEPKQCRFIPHFGLTAAILPPESTTPAAVKDPEKSRALFHEATALIEKKQTKEAAAKLQAAVDADDQNTAAWAVLTTLHAETDNIDAFTALCRRWAQAMPKSYQPHNVLGKYLETKGKFAEALAEYRKSIEIEPNQPPIRDDIERLEKKLKEQ